MIYFKSLGEVYVQSGTYTFQKKYREGYAHVQGLESVVGDTNPETLKTLPEYFVNEWAQFMYPLEDKDLTVEHTSYDKGAYGVGIPVQEVRYLNIPQFKKVHLMYFHTTNVNNETREVVQFTPEDFVEYEGTLADGTQGTVTADEFVKILTTKYWESEREYYSWLNEIGALRGFNRSGKAYPPSVVRSPVSELSSLKGELDLDGDGTPETPITIHVTPMYIQNGFPIFDMVYLHNDSVKTAEGEIASGIALQYGRLLRWYNGFTSEYRAPINYTDHSIGGVNIATGSSLDGSDRPAIPDQLVIDGETYINSDAYNVTRKLQ